MSNSISEVGGARIGWANVSWPMARLTVDADEIQIKVLIFGTYAFKAKEILRIEKTGSSLPIFGSGIRIFHSNPDFPKKIIFWSLKNPEGLLKEINATGFSAQGIPTAELKSRGFPLRWGPLVAAIIIWNLFFLQEIRPGEIPKTPGPIALVPIFLAFFFCLASVKSTKFQKIILKPGRNFGEVQHWFRLLLLILSIFVVVFPVLVLSGLAK